MSWRETFSKIAGRLKAPERSLPSFAAKPDPQAVLEAGIITPGVIDHLTARTAPRAAAEMTLTPDDPQGWSFARQQADTARRRAIQYMREDLQNFAQKTRRDFDQARGRKEQDQGYER
ncbi:MAG: hypothetical protein AAFU81_11795 [Pseudomonadota bacterium]